MKTKELIRQLQEADPDGDKDCCVDNTDIFYVGIEPAYCDGCKQILIRDKDCEYYNIIGGKVSSEGSKLVITTLSIESAIWNKPDMPIEYDGYSEKHYKEGHEEERKKAKSSQ